MSLSEDLRRLDENQLKAFCVLVQNPHVEVKFKRPDVPDTLGGFGIEDVRPFFLKRRPGDPFVPLDVAHFMNGGKQPSRKDLSWVNRILRQMRESGELTYAPPQKSVWTVAQIAAPTEPTEPTNNQ